MIEVTEVWGELETPNEADAERIFAMFKKSMETLQIMLQAEVKQFDTDGVKYKKLSLEIEPMEMTVRVGDWILWHRIEHHTYKV